MKLFKHGMQIAPWLVYALLGAVMAALAGVFTNWDEEIDSTFATAIRAAVGTVLCAAGDDGAGEMAA